MLDFTEIATGEGFELLVRDLLVAMRYRVTWSGRGPDNGKDLLVDEPGDQRFGSKPRRWLISCKHNALANGGSGRSVNAEDIGSHGGIADAVDEHGASGFLVVCSTQPSSSLVERLASIEARRGISTHYWDRQILQGWLDTPAGWGVAQRYMPKSAAEPHVYATESPNKWVVVVAGHFVRLTNRHESFVSFQLSMIEEFVAAINECHLPDRFYLRLRGLYHDDKNLGFSEWYVDCIYQEVDLYGLDEPMTEDEIAASIEAFLSEHEANKFRDASIEVKMQPVNYASESFDPDHHSFYRSLPGYL